jgi:D-3-phosphoglycerate dehydrogenase / 2-oxoglutarate reductase
MPRALVLEHVFPDLRPEREVLEPRGVEVVDGTDLEAAARLVLAEEADAVLAQYSTIDAAVVGRLRRCRLLGSYWVGYDQIDVAAAAARGITVVHVPDYGTEEVSDHALCLLLGLARGLAGLQAGLRAGQWEYTTSGPLRRLRGRTLGIVGFGRIGRRVAAKARGFGLRILASDPFLAPSVFGAHDVESRPLDRLLEEADLVSLHVPLTESTRRLLDARAFDRLKPGAYLVNTARGAVVDEAALLRALDSGRLAGAGLDVLAVEPPAPDHPLLRHPRVLVTPHSAWYTEEAMRDLQRLLAEDVARVLAGQPARCPVTPPSTERAPATA